MPIERKSNRQDREQLRQHLVRKWRTNFQVSREQAEWSARYLVGMADISVTEFEGQGTRGFDKMLQVAWHDGSISAQAFVASDDGKLKPLWFDSKPNPTPDRRQHLCLAGRFFRTVVLRQC